jgi:hypothetical protein
MTCFFFLFPGISVTPTIKVQNVLEPVTSLKLRSNIAIEGYQEEANDDVQNWEIKPEEIKIDFNDPNAKIGHGSFGDVYKVSVLSPNLSFF